jgi:hypothetical protein
MNDIDKAIENHKKCVEYIEKDLQCQDEELYKMDKPTRDEIESAKRDHLLAIKALEKQVAKNPIEIKERHNFSGDVIYKDGYCPDCKNEISSSYRFCTLCGQKLDWSDKP